MPTVTVYTIRKNEGNLTESARRIESGKEEPEFNFFTHEDLRTMEKSHTACSFRTISICSTMMKMDQ